MTDGFCAVCGIKLQGDGGAISDLGNFLFGGAKKTHELEDGSYCEKCAKLRVEKKRRRV